MKYIFSDWDVFGIKNNIARYMDGSYTNCIYVYSFDKILPKEYFCGFLGKGRVFKECFFLLYPQNKFRTLDEAKLAVDNFINKIDDLMVFI